jgi:hypothetical protein
LPSHDHFLLSREHLEVTTLSFYIYSDYFRHHHTNKARNVAIVL